MKPALLLAAVVLALSPTAAWAYCLHFPDDARTHFIENGQRHLLCLEQELSATTEAQAAQVQLQQTLAELQAQIARQQAQAQAAVTLSLPVLPSLQ